MLLAIRSISRTLPLRGQQVAVETARSHIYALHRPQIEETYRIECDGESVVLKAQSTWLRNSFPGALGLREANLRMRPDVTPERLEIIVSSSPTPEISLAIEIKGGVANVR